MKNFTRSFLPLLVTVAAIGLTAYSGGMAAAGERGYTGAPTATGGTEPTCSICHNDGSFGEPRLSLQLDGEDVTVYRPGQTYRITVAVRPEQGKPAGYGFQAQFLTNDDAPTAVGKLSAPGAESQITELSNGRVYAEHVKINPDSLFTFDWTAPEAGTGDVKFYAVGNTVNQSGSIGGDNGSSKPLIVTLTEETATGTYSGPLTAGHLSLFPNPARNRATLRLEATVSEDAVISVVGPDGRVMRRNPVSLQAGTNEWPLDVHAFPAGIYRVTVIGERQRFFNRLVKN